jgi:HD-GYP domain-containing protein (c-di-GMP phosphodiesterase class II)
MRLPPETVRAVAEGAYLHDIGKIAVPDVLLNKPGRLSDDERRIVEQHPVTGWDIVGRAPSLRHALAAVHYHHERWDGSGYPDGRVAVESHLFARIAAAVDVFDAVTSARVYRAPMPPHAGVRIIREGAGTAFDASVVESFNRVVMPFPVGYGVTLPDGREGVVSSVDPDHPDRPVVRYREGASFAEAPVDLSGLLAPAEPVAA